MVVGFFMPLPLAMMIPFMGIQSAVMAKQFGENFQYGKRRISAMSNEEFNKLTPQKLMENANEELKSMIPSMQKSLEDMRGFQIFVVKEFLLTIRAVIDAGLGRVLGLNPTEINNIVQDIEHFLHGHGFGEHPREDVPPVDEPTPDPTVPLLNPSPSDVRGWTDGKLQFEFEHRLHLYTKTAQGIITSFYNARIKDKLPPKEKFPTEPEKPFEHTLQWFLKEAQGQVTANPPTNVAMRSKLTSGKWVTVKSGPFREKNNFIELARAAWPSSSYKENDIGSQRKFWTLKTKF